jgi:hypothetical protein
MFIIVKGGNQIYIFLSIFSLSCVDYRKMVKVASDKLKRI